MGNFDAVEHPPKKPSMEIKNPRKSTIHGATERTLRFRNYNLEKK